MSRNPLTAPGAIARSPIQWRRRRWLTLVAAGAAALCAAGPAGAAASAEPADTVLRNGFVYTVDDKDSVAQALAVDDGEIVYVGSDAGARRFIGPDTEVIDLEGRMAMPGIHDGHIHGVTKSDQKTCDLQAAPLTVPELQARLQACLDDPELGSEPDDFLIVENLYMQFLRPAGTAPHKSMLDALDTDRPIVIYAAVTGHTILVNQKALDLAGITSETPDPPGGRIDHDPDGEPNGLLQDNAWSLVTDLIPPPPPVSPERALQLAGQRMHEFSREGVTTFFVPGLAQSPSTGFSPVDEETIGPFKALQDRGELTARAHFAPMPEISDFDDPQELYARVEQLRAEFEDPDELPVSVRSWRPGVQRGPRLAAQPGVSVDGVKLFLDGVAQFPSQTAAMLEPYLDADGNPRTDESARGELFADGPLLNPIVAELERRGFQPHIHAVGDRAVRVALDSFEAARQVNPGIRSHPTIAHAEIVDPADYDRFGEYDVTASMGLQWAKPAPDSTEAVKPYVGSRWDQYEPTAPITQGGGRVSLGSDCCLDPFDEWFDLEVAILREADWGPEFPEFAGTLNALPGLTLREGIRALTINGAYQMHQEKVTGSLEEGKLADLVVLDQNITQVPLDDISDTDVLLTMVGGKKVWVDPSLG